MPDNANTKADQAPVGALYVSNTEAEQALLGAMLINNDAYGLVSSFLEPEHFYEPVHGRIFEACRKLIASGKTATPVLLKPLFDRDESLTDAGGGKYLARLAGSAVSIGGARGYGEVIYDLWQRREAALLAVEMESLFAVDSKPASDLVAEYVGKLGDLLTGPQASDTGAVAHYANTALNASEDAQKRGTGIVGVATGLTELDRYLGGLEPGDLVIAAGRPSIGKSDVAVNLAYNAALAGEPVYFVSLEMDGKQIARRILARLTGISADRQRRGDINPDEWRALTESTDTLGSLPLNLDCVPQATVEHIASRARRMKRRGQLSLLIIDYLQLIRTTGRNDNRVAQVTQISQDCKALARTLEVPVILLSQLSRAVEQRDDKRPRLSDLRDSGSIEQDADAVLLLYRDSYYLERQEPERESDKWADWASDLNKCKNLLDIDVAKNRMGRLGRARCYYSPEKSTVGDLAGNQPSMEVF